MDWLKMVFTRQTCEAAETLSPLDPTFFTPHLRPGFFLFFGGVKIGPVGHVLDMKGVQQNTKCIYFLP